MNDFQKQLSDSAMDFKDLVWPIIKNKCPWAGNGWILPMETLTAEQHAKLFDRYAGIDAWQILDDKKSIRGLASRIQWGNNAIDKKTGKPWNTFTIRWRTRDGIDCEGPKRIRAIEEGLLYPALICHAYLKELHGSVLSIGICKTTLVYKYILQEICTQLSNKVDGNIFKIIQWIDISENESHDDCWFWDSQ